MSFHPQHIRIWSAENVVMHAYEENAVLGAKDQPIRLPTGIQHIDEALYGGIAKTGTITVVGGAPNTGKTRVMYSIAKFQADLGFSPGYIQLDDDPTLTGEVFQMFFSGISSGEIYRNGSSYRNSEKIIRAVDAAAKCKVKFAFPSDVSHESVAAHYHAFADAGCDVVFVDYFSSIAGDSKQGERSGFNAALRVLKKAAKERGIPIILAAQIKNKEPYYSKKDGKRVAQEVTMFDLGETAELSRMARNVIVMWKDDNNNNLGRVEKQKHERRQTGKFHLWLDPDGTIWSEDYTKPAQRCDANGDQVDRALRILNSGDAST